MKKISLAILFACFTLALTAQDGIPVKYQGDRPTISDFATALFTYESGEDEDCDESFNAVKQAWNSHRNGGKLYDNETLTIDQKSGYIVYESRYEDELLRVEMCYWNEIDKKHKLIAYNVSCFSGGKYSAGQYDGLRFYRYNNATRNMIWYDEVGFEVEYTAENGAWVSYDLPRTGKDIIVNYWYENDRKQKTLIWDGHKFSL